jgi:hypothetical protein
LRPGEFLTHGRGLRNSGNELRPQAARRLRPRARRRARTARPLLVAMRARNPWVRLRLITLG